MEDSSNGKKCPTCGQWKTYSEYYRNRSKVDGHQTSCKPCFAAANRASCAKNAEHHKERNRRRMRETYAERGEERRAKTAEWYAERGREWHKTYRQEHPEQYREATKKWRAKENNSSNAIRRRRAKLVGSGGQHTEEQWQSLAAEYNFCCAACGKLPTGIWPDVLTRDHVLPLVNGGTDNIDNIQPLCLSCNASKNMRTIDYRGK